VSAGADNRAVAGPLSGCDLMGIARVMPDPAIRTRESARTFAGAAETFTAAFVDPTLRPRPMRRPTAGLGRRNRGGDERC
jgi:hypothetical protein